MIEFKTETRWAGFTAPLHLSPSVRDGYQTATFAGTNVDGDAVTELITVEVRNGIPILYEHHITRIPKEGTCPRTRTGAKRSSSKTRRRSA